MFLGPIWSWIQGLYFQINKIKYFQHFYSYENFCKSQTLHKKHVKNFSPCILHNFSCIHATYLEGPTISDNLISDLQWFSSNCAADYFGTLSITVFVLYESLKISQLYIFMLKYMCNYISYNHICCVQEPRLFLQLHHSRCVHLEPGQECYQHLHDQAGLWWELCSTARLSRDLCYWLLAGMIGYYILGQLSEDIQGVPKRIRLCFCLISQQPSIGFLNRFFPLKTEIRTQILNTKPFLCNIRGLRYLQNKMGFFIRWFC